MRKCFLASGLFPYLTFAGMLLSVLFVSCRKEGSPEEPNIPVQGQSVWILNEGTFNWGNASIDVLNAETGQLSSDVFMAVNKRPLGDVLQSVTFVGNEAWLVVNNSMKIERINPADFKSKGTIDGLRSPRYLLPLDSKVYVSDLYSGEILVLDKFNGSKLKSIACAGWTEEMLFKDGFVWVCNVRKKKVYLINPESDKLVDSVSVGDAPRSIVCDKRGQIWVLCEGEIPPSETPGSLWCIDPVSRVVKDSMSFPAGSHPSNLCLNADSDQLYFLWKGVRKMSIDDSQIPSTAWIEQGTQQFYGLAVNKADGNVWVSDAGDFVQRGKVMRYNSSAELKGSWQVGVIPRSFYFY